MSYFDAQSNKHYLPHIIETSGGVDRAALFFLIDAYHEDKDRIILKLDPKLAPHKVAVFPLLANKAELVKKAREVYLSLITDHSSLNVVWDDRGNIGKRYLAQDEAGTPFCITIDFDTLKDDSVTMRDRDTNKQKRIKTSKIAEEIFSQLS